jgi:integration host factor subunit beta
MEMEKEPGMQTITKRDLIDRIARSTGYRRTDVKKTLSAFVDVMIEELARGNRIEFRDLGVFETKVRAPRIAQNPKTLERVAVPARTTVKFKAGGPVRKRLACEDAPPAKPKAAAKSRRRPAKRRPGGEVEAKPPAAAAV